MLRFAIILLLALGAFSTAYAADAGALLYGNWIDQKQRGGLAIEFKPATMSFLSLDAAGKPAGAPRVAQVKYVSSGGMITVSAPDGKGAFTVTIQDDNDIVVEIPGLPSTRYRRVTK